MVTTKQATVNPLPPLPDGLEYRYRSYAGQHYVTTGGFPVGAPDATLKHLASVGVLILDFDLVDYVSAMSGAGHDATDDQRKIEMYRKYAGKHNEPLLCDVKHQHRTKVLEAVEAMVSAIPGGARPSFVVDSGWGVHCYFWLKTPTTTRDGIDGARALNKRMVGLINGACGYSLADDGVHDTGTRILRVVGSMNTQSQVKAKIGDPIETMVLTGLGDPESRWDLDASLSSMEGKSESGAWSGKPERALDDVAATGDGETAAFRMLKGYAMQRLPKDAWKRAENEKNSEADAALAFALCMLRFPLSAVAALIKSARGPSKHDQGDYFQRTAFNAWTYARGSIKKVTADTNFDMMHDDVVMRLEGTFTSVITLSIVAQYDPRVRAMIWVDERTRKIEWNTDHDYRAARAFCAHQGIELPAERNGRRDFGDDQAIRLCNWIGLTYGIPCGEKWRESMCIILAALEKRNPVRDELEACGKLARETGGPDLLSTWLLRAFPGLQDSPLLRVYSRKWLVGGAARAIDPGVFIKGMLVIVGEQSAGKSSMLRILGGRWYASPKVRELANKDSLMSYHYSWLLEMEEMDFMRGNSIEAVKSFLTTQEDKYRVPYGRDMATFHRPCFYAGTANKSGILSDTTGNVRFWCVDLPSGARCDFDWLTRNRDLLIGQAYNAWMAVRGADINTRNTAINLTIEEQRAQEGRNVDFVSVDERAPAVLASAWEAMTTCPRGVNGTLPLRCTILEVAEKLFAGPSHSTVAEKLTPSMQASLKAILEQEGYQKRNDRLPDGSRPRMFYAPESLNERYRARGTAHLSSVSHDRFGADPNVVYFDGASRDEIY